jgi:hypothetical protein
LDDYERLYDNIGALDSLALPLLPNTHSPSVHSLYQGLDDYTHSPSVHSLYQGLDDYTHSPSVHSLYQGLDDYERLYDNVGALDSHNGVVDGDRDGGDKDASGGSVVTTRHGSKRNRNGTKRFAYADRLLMDLWYDRFTSDEITEAAVRQQRKHMRWLWRQTNRKDTVANDEVGDDDSGSAVDNDDGGDAKDIDGGGNAKDDDDVAGGDVALAMHLPPCYHNGPHNLYLLRVLF